MALNDLIAETVADMELKPAEQRLCVNIDFPWQVEVPGSPSLPASVFRNRDRGGLEFVFTLKKQS